MRARALSLCRVSVQRRSMAPFPKRATATLAPISTCPLSLNVAQYTALKINASLNAEVTTLRGFTFLLPTLLSHAFSKHSPTLVRYPSSALPLIRFFFHSNKRSVQTTPAPPPRARACATRVSQVRAAWTGRARYPAIFAVPMFYIRNSIVCVARPCCEITV